MKPKGKDFFRHLEPPKPIPAPPPPLPRCDVAGCEAHGSHAGPGYVRCGKHAPGERHTHPRGAPYWPGDKTDAALALCRMWQNDVTEAQEQWRQR